VADIVNLQAQYGISATADSNKIIQWVNAKDAAGWNTAIDGPKVIDPATGAATNFGPGLTILNRNLIKAARIAVVARNGLLEKTQVSYPCGNNGTTTLPLNIALTMDAPPGLCAWAGSSAGTTITGYAPAIDLSNDPNWQNYRYRVFETIIPMRNIIWSGTSLP
jgi:type IV pilus assembly protein PilW